MFKKANGNPRFLSLILSILVICMMIPLNASALKLTDISNHWAKDTIEEWIDQELIEGYSDGSFKPDNNISRAEFITMVNKAFGYKSTAPISYSDVKLGAWYYNPIEIAEAAEYIEGYSDGTMKPENSITREEAATILMKINKLTGNESAADVFTDSKNFTWSKGAIGEIYTAGLMEGYSDGSFKNKNFLKRGEALVTLNNNLEYVTETGTPLALPGTPITPPLPKVTGDDTRNTVKGMLNTMEYKLDSGKWTPYVPSVFKALDLKGNHTLLVRYAASGINPHGPEIKLVFKKDRVSPSGGTSGGGSGGSSGGGGSSDNDDNSTPPAETTINVRGVTLNKPALNLKVGGLTQTLVATVNPLDATNKSVIWTSSNSSVATVRNGVVTPISVGTTVITVKTVDGGFTATSLVTVEPVEGTIQDQEAPTGLEGVAPTSFGGSDGKITGTTSEMEYRELSVQTWTDVTGSEITGLTAGHYDVRYKAKPGYNEGIAATIGVAPGPIEDQGAPTGLEGIAPTSYGGSDGYITGTTSEMEYRLLTDDTWTEVAGSEITDLEAGTYDVRYRAKEGFNEGVAATITVPVRPNQNQDAPTGLEGIAPTTYGGSDGYITGTTSEMEYRLLADDTWTPATEGETTGLISGWYDVRYAAKEGYDPSSAATINIAEGPNQSQEAPTGLEGIAPTSFGGNDGKITGTTSEMEYRSTSIQTWTDVTGSEITGLEAGWYDVRYKAKPGYNEGFAATIGVAPGPNEDQPAPTGLMGIAPTTFGGDDGKITGTTSDMEYRTLEDPNYKPVTGSEITGLKAGFYYVRYAEKPGYNPGAFVEILLGEREASLSAIAIDGILVQGFSPGIFTYDIELPAGTTIVPTVTATATDSNAPVVVTPASELPGETTILVTAQNGTSTQTYTIKFILANQVPLGLKGVAPTTSGGSDGKIIGTTNEMEYRISTDDTWITVNGGEITGLTAGTYLVRYAAKDGYSVGTPAYVVVPNPGTGKLIFTFDDGWKDTIEVGKPILDLAGFKATVYVNRDVTQAAEYGWSDYHIENVMNYDDLHELYNQGWDISNHSTNHLDYKRSADGSLLLGLDDEPLEHQTPEAYGAAHPEIPEEQVYTEWLKTLVPIGSDASEATIERLKEVYEDNQIWIGDNGPDRLGKLVDGVWVPGRNLNMPLSAKHIAYPSGLFSDELVTMIQSIGAETGRATTENDTNNNIVGAPDFFRLPVQYVETRFEGGIDVNLADVLASIDYAVDNGSTVILMLHRVGPVVNPENNLFVEEESLQSIVSHAKGFTDAGTLDVMTISQWYNMMK